MGYLREKSEVVVFTPEKAAELLKTAPYDLQRNFRPELAARYAELIRRNEFEVDTIKVHTFRGDQFLTNGQHRLRAIIETGIPLKQVLLTLEAETMDDVHAAYRRTDAGASRSLSDKLRTVEDLRKLGLNASQLSVSSTACLVVLAGFQGISVSNTLGPYERSEETRIKGLHYWAEELVAFWETVGKRSKRSGQIWRNGCVIGVSLVILRYQNQRGQAVEYLQRVANVDMLKPKTGMWHFHNLLTRGQEENTMAEYSKRIASCWNAHYENPEKEFRFTQVRNPDSPIFIAGTPFRGNALPPLSYE